MIRTEERLFPFTDRDISFDHDGIPRRIRTGENEIDRIATHLDTLDCRRVLVLCGPHVLNESDVVQRVEQQLGSRLAGRFSEARPHSPLSVLRVARALAQELEPDCVVSVGGGSTMAIAKGLTLLDATDEPLTNFEMRFEDPGQPSRQMNFPNVRMKVISVPTTVGCAEFGRHVGGFTNDDRTEKIVIKGDGQTGPHLIVIDGLALASTPTHIQRSTTIGALRMAVESFASIRHTPFSDALNLHALRLMRAALDGEWQQEPIPLIRLKIAAALSAMGITEGLGATSALAHQLGAVCDVPHGEGNAVMLAEVVRWNASAVGERMQVLADAFAIVSDDKSPEEIGGLIADAITATNRKLGVPASLRDLSIPKSAFPTIAAAALRDMSMHTNPRPIKTEAEVIELLEAAW